MDGSASGGRLWLAVSNDSGRAQHRWNESLLLARNALAALLKRFETARVDDPDVQAVICGMAAAYRIALEDVSLCEDTAGSAELVAIMLMVERLNESFASFLRDFGKGQMASRS